MHSATTLMTSQHSLTVLTINIAQQNKAHRHPVQWGVTKRTQQTTKVTVMLVMAGMVMAMATTFLTRLPSLTVRGALFTMDSAVLGLGSSGCSNSTVRAFRQKFALEDAIEFHAFAPWLLPACDQWHSSRVFTPLTVWYTVHSV
jgi:hypothetical protein